MKLPDKRNMRGFTLVELMITLAVAAVLLSIMVPSMRDFMINNRVSTQADQFFNVVQTARSEAIKRSVAIRVSALDSDDDENEWGKGVRLWIDENDDGEFNSTANEEIEGDVADTVIALYDVLSNSHTLDANADNEELVFSPTGRSNAADRFFLCGENNRGIGREIYVTRSGRVGVADYACE